LQGNPKKSLPKTQFSVYRFFAPFFQRKEQGSKGRSPLGRTHLKHAGALPLPPRQGGFLKKSPLHPKNFEDSKKLRFLQGNPKKSLPKTQFSAISLLCFFLSKKEAGFQGAAPLGGRTRPQHRRALPCTRLRDFLKKVP